MVVVVVDISDKQIKTSLAGGTDEETVSLLYDYIVFLRNKTSCILILILYYLKMTQNNDQ